MPPTYVSATDPFSGILNATMPATSGSRVIPRVALSPKIVNGDYVKDADGQLTDGDDATEEVLFLLGTLVGTFVAPDGTTRGNGVVRIQAMTDRAPLEVQDAVMHALASAINRGSIKDVKVTPEPYAQAGTAVMQYTVSYIPTRLV